jgi:hypothetical protein
MEDLLGIGFVLSKFFTTEDAEDCINLFVLRVKVIGRRFSHIHADLKNLNPVIMFIDLSDFSASISIPLPHGSLHALRVLAVNFLFILTRTLDLWFPLRPLRFHALPLFFHETFGITIRFKGSELYGFDVPKASVA